MPVVVLMKGYKCIFMVNSVIQNFVSSIVGIILCVRVFVCVCVCVCVWYKMSISLCPCKHTRLLQGGAP